PLLGAIANEMKQRRGRVIGIDDAWAEVLVEQTVAHAMRDRPQGHLQSQFDRRLPYDRQCAVFLQRRDRDARMPRDDELFEAFLIGFDWSCHLSFSLARRYVGARLASPATGDTSVAPTRMRVNATRILSDLFKPFIMTRRCIAYVFRIRHRR